MATEPPRVSAFSGGDALGEIDLSAGTASGVTAAVLALHLVSGGNLLDGLGLGVFVVFCVLLVLAIGIGIQLRIWAATVAPAIALAMVLLGAQSTRAREVAPRCCSRSAPR